jgi:RecG-like helicase
MVCPHCSTVVHFEWSSTGAISKATEGLTEYEITYAPCPKCSEIVTYLDKGKAFIISGEWRIKTESRTMIHPKANRLENTADIPKLYLEDYEEAIKVLSSSAKASAALSRRLLQNILREYYKIQEKSLSEEIKKFVELPGIPSHLIYAVDAIRNIGNLAAHPTKDKSTGEIVPVEIGEAEWLIEVIEALFDFTFIQPAKLQRRKEELNKKLERIGKPQMK